MSNIPITSLPIAAPLDGNEAVPIVQGGTTKRTTTLALSTFPDGTATGNTYLTATVQTGLVGSRLLSAAVPVLLTDNGAGSTLVISISGAVGTSVVSSVGLSGGSTGLTISGTPVTTAGTMTIGGLLNVASGGVGTSNLTAHGVVIGNSTSAVNITSPGTGGQLLVGQTSTSDPQFVTMSGDATITLAGALTIANNAVTNAKAAQMASYTIKGNVTNATANATDFTIDGLTLKSSVATSDEFMIWDVAGAAIKKTRQSFVTSGISIMPQGRLTLLTGTPVMTSGTSGVTTIYYTAYQGTQVPIYDGTNMVPTALPGGEVSVLTTNTTKSPAAIGASKVNDWFIWNDAGTVRLGHGPDWSSDTARSAGAAIARTFGIYVNSVAITNGPGTSQGTYVGTTRSNGTASIDFVANAAGSGGAFCSLGVWNYYNRVPIGALVRDSGSSYAYTTATVRQARNSSNNAIGFVVGIAEDAIYATYVQTVTLLGVAGAFTTYGIGYDTTVGFSVACINQSSGTGSASHANSIATIFSPFSSTIAGFHNINAVEKGDGSNANLFDPFTDAALCAIIEM